MTPKGERVGLYQLELSSKEVTPLVLEMPKVDGIGGAPKVYAAGTGPVLAHPTKASDSSRAFAFCNDLAVSRAGQSEIVQQNLPTMPDGLDRDANGTIWIGMIKQRSAAVDWIHAHPWIKPLLLRLPDTMMPVSRETSYMALSQDGYTPLFYSLHDGSVLSEISVVIPGRDRLYLATVGHEAHGLYSVPYPKGLQPAAE